MDCGSNVSSLLKAFTVLSGSVCACTTQWPVWDLGRSLPISSVLKVLGMLIRIKSTHVQVWGELRSSETTLQGWFPELLSLYHLTSMFWFQIRSSVQKLPTSMNVPYPRQSRRKTERPEKQWESATTLRPKDPPKREEASMPSRVLALASFLFMAALAAAITAPATEVPGLEHEKMKIKGEKENLVCLLHSTWALGVSLPHLEPKAKGFFSGSLSIIPQCLLQGFRLYWVRLRDTKVKKPSKLMTGSMALWIQVFFPNTPADIYFQSFQIAVRVFSVDFIVDFRRR